MDNSLQQLSDAVAQAEFEYNRDSLIKVTASPAVCRTIMRELPRLIGWTSRTWQKALDELDEIEGLR